MVRFLLSLWCLVLGALAAAADYQETVVGPIPSALDVAVKAKKEALHNDAFSVVIMHGSVGQDAADKIESPQEFAIGLAKWLGQGLSLIHI